MEFKSVQKYIITSPRKLREVAGLVKKLNPSDAIEKMPFLRKKAADPLRKVINTAIANAKQKGISESDLVFKEIQINDGPRLKRFRPGARGRAKPYKKRMSHIRVVLETKEAGEKKESQKQVRTSQSPKPARDDKAGIKSLPTSSKSRKGGKARKNQRKSAKKSA